MSLLFTQEGLNIVRPLMVGGATSMYCGCAAPPPAWLEDRVRRRHRRRGLRDHGGAGDRPAARRSCAARPPPASPRPPRPWATTGSRSSSSCARRAADSFELRGQVHARLPLRRQVERRRVGGRGGRGRRRPAHPGQRRARADRGRPGRRGAGHAGRRSLSPPAPDGVLAAGGIGTPRILQALRLWRAAGHGMTMDVTVMVYGFVKERGHRQRAAHDLVVGEPGRRLHAQHPDRPLAALPDHHRAQEARGIRSTGRAGTTSWA